MVSDAGDESGGVAQVMVVELMKVVAGDVHGHDEAAVKLTPVTVSSTPPVKGPLVGWMDDATGSARSGSGTSIQCWSLWLDNAMVELYDGEGMGHAMSVDERKVDVVGLSGACEKRHQVDEVRGKDVPWMVTAVEEEETMAVGLTSGR